MPTVQTNASTAKDENPHQQTNDPRSEMGDKGKITSIDEAAIHELQVGSEDREILYGTSSDGTRLILTKFKGDRYVITSIRLESVSFDWSTFYASLQCPYTSVMRRSSDQPSCSLFVFLETLRLILLLCDWGSKLMSFLALRPRKPRMSLLFTLKNGLWIQGTNPA